MNALGGTMDEFAELKMDKHTILRMKKLMNMLLTEKDRIFQISQGRRQDTK
jgi:hypothetical protein